MTVGQEDTGFETELLLQKLCPHTEGLPIAARPLSSTPLGPSTHWFDFQLFVLF